MRADTLFASARDAARQAIAEAIGRYGGRGLSARVAQAYGDHPDPGTRPHDEIPPGWDGPDWTRHGGLDSDPGLPYQVRWSS